MRNRNRCAAWLGLAGACLFAIGCGSDVPDPASDANAASGAPGGDGGAGAPAPAVAAADAPKADEAAPAEKPAEAPKDQAKGNSATSEMLALSGGANPPAPGGGAAAAPQPSAPGAGRGAPGPGPGAPGPGAPGAMGGGLKMGAPPGGGANPGNMAGMAGRMGPGAPGMPQQQQQQQPDMAKMMQAQMGNRGGAMQPGPGGGGMGGPGGNAADTGPVDTHSPQGVVKAFLGALKSKDADRLVEATARRAASEATSSRNRELFGKILEVSLSDSEMDDLAKKLDGYKISGENPPRSTAKVDVVIRKSGPNGSYMVRRVTTRHEKKGWGVLDISGEQVFKALGAIRRPGAGRKN